MNRIAMRANVLILVAALLLAGVGFFVADYTMNAESWVMSGGSPHIYDENNEISTGLVIDRDGIILLDMREEKAYSDDEQIRKSTVHWLGSRLGNVPATILEAYNSKLAGYDAFSGLYSYSGDGGIMEMTLSTQVQKVALEAMGNRRGVVAVYNYKTGKLLCAVSTSTFDPDNVPEITEENREEYDSIYYHRFVQSAYTPGSIFKIVTLAAALEEIPDIEKQTFTCRGEYKIGEKTVKCEGVHWDQDLKTAFKNSCNCAFAQIAEQLGGETMERYVHQFGIVDSISFDGITTAPGNYSIEDEDGNGNDYEVAWSSIGQYKDQVNPCAFMVFVGAIANGGRPVMPRVVDNVTCDGSATYTSQAITGGRIMSEKTAKTVCAYMTANVEEKYGASNFEGLTVGAKTGTGEVGGGKASNSMFAGFVADKDCPLAFVVMVENGGYGLSTCMPIASKVIAACKEVLG